MYETLLLNIQEVYARLDGRLDGRLWRLGQVLWMEYLAALFDPASPVTELSEKAFWDYVADELEPMLERAEAEKMNIEFDIRNAQ